jgi:hypothetical protein
MPEIFENTFQKGLNSDFQIIYQPEGSYRYMKNCSLISQDGNNYAVKDVVGNTLLFTLNSPYDEFYTLVGAPPTPLAFVSFPDRLIIISTNNADDNNVGYMEIGEVRMLPYGQGIKPESVVGQYNSGYTPLYHHKDLNGSLNHRVEAFAYSENELVNRIYFTDNYNEPRVFNVSDPIFSNYISSGSLVSGEQYMVLEGAISYNGDTYAPGVILGNVFTANATSTFTDLTGPSPSPKVVKYYPYQLLNWTPSRTLGDIKFNRYDAGNVYCGSKVYFYRLSTPEAVTGWSYGSYPIHVGTINDPDVSGIAFYHNFVGNGSANTLANSGYSVILNIDNIDTNYTYLELACAEYDNISNFYRSLSIVSKVIITGSSMEVEHDGNQNLGELTLDDVTLFPASILKVKTLGTSKNYNLIGNLTERPELELDFSGVTVQSFQYPMNSHADPNSCTLGGMVYAGPYPALPFSANPAIGTVMPNSRWLVIYGDNTDTVTYGGNQYYTGEVITGVVPFTTITCVGAGGVRPCVTRNRYTVSNPLSADFGKRRENAIELKTAFWDYKDPAVHHHAQGYWSNEKYRFGIIPVDKKGNPYYARWAADYTFPTAESKGGIMTGDPARPEPYNLNPSGLKINNLIIPESEIDKIGGFMVVRAERDARILTQGLLTQSVHTAATPDEYRPGAYIPVSADNLAVAQGIYSYLCPDSAVGAASTRGFFGQTGDLLEQASWFMPFDYEVGGGTNYVRAGGAQAQIYSKMIQYATDSLTPRTGTINYFGTVDENQVLSDLGSGNTFANRNMRIGNGAGTTPVITCIGGVPYSLDNHEAVGCRKVVIGLEAGFRHLNDAANDYDSIAADTNSGKILMNYVKKGIDSNDLYGGSSDSAKANTLYISTGHFQAITDQVKLDTYNGIDAYVFDDIEIFGGDCFTCLIDIGYGTWNQSYSYPFSYAWTFPCECNANYNLRRGRKTSNVQMYWGPGSPADSIAYLLPTGLPRLEDYSYNPGYTSEGQGFAYAGLPVDFVNASKFKARVRYAGPKIIGESKDSFRTFVAGDFKDLSAQYGRINNIKVKDDRVIVFQDLSVNTVPILERQLLGGGTNAQTTIGTGGVVDRFDVVTSYFGNQHQWGVTETEYGFIWFDMHRKAALVLGLDGSGMREISLVYGMQGFFNEAFLEAVGVNTLDTTNILNSQDFSETSDRPLVGIGITGVYDPKFKMSYLTFKFKARKKIPADLGPIDAYLTKDFTLGYLHSAVNTIVVGFYDFLPCIAHNHNQWVFAANNPKNTTQFLPADLTGVSFAIGETINYVAAYAPDNGEYICIAPVTLSNIAENYPDQANGSTYWALINKTSQLWALNQPSTLGQLTAPDYQYNKFFGKVVDNELWLVANPPQGITETFNVTNIEQISSSYVNYTSISTESEGQTAADLNITPWDVRYRFIFNKIVSSLPRISGNASRLFGNYLLMKFYKKNWSTNPTTTVTQVKILQKLRSLFTLRR